MQRIEFQPAYILHARPYRETSLILELFTRDYGRMSAIAKGARRPKAFKKGLLQPFIPLIVSCVGRGELLNLRDFDSSGIWPRLVGRNLVSAFYLNELLMRLLHRFDPNDDLFYNYDTTLKSLAQVSDVQEVLRLFEKALLKNLGYELQLNKEADTGDAIDPEAFYTFDPERGPLLALKSGTKVAVQYAFRGKSLLALQLGELNEASVLIDAKRLMRQALAPHLGAKPLESRRLL